MSSKLLDAFHIEKKETSIISSDYEIFADKQLLEEIRSKVLEGLSNQRIGKKNIRFDIIEQEVLDKTYEYHLTSGERNYIYHIIENELNGYGPLTELIKDDNITEIMVNSPKDIYIETDGVIKKDSSVSFINEDHILRTIEKLLEPSGKTMDIHNPIIDVILEDGSRMNAMIPPISKTPILTIRKFQQSIESMDTLVGVGALTPYMARFLEAAVLVKLNIIICGSSGSGKTTLLNILSNLIPEKERIVTIEGVREIKLHQENVISLASDEARNEQGKNITLSALVQNSLRMRPDRIVLGEMKGGEAYSLLQAMNTGVEGSITTLHANNSKEAMERIETMILMAGLDIPTNALREYMNRGIDIIVQTMRLRDGKRKITAISEVVDVKDGEFVLEDIFIFKTEGMTENGALLGEYSSLSKNPSCLKKLAEAGFPEIKELFKKTKVKKE